MQKNIFTSLLLTFICSTIFASSYNKSYAIVISKKNLADKSWGAVALALKDKHHGKIITYDKTPDESLPQLQKLFPKYTCFIVKPEEAGFKLVVNLHRLIRKLDNDPYADTIHSIITGYTAADALRMAKATKPRIASTALISAGMGPERFKEAGYLSTSTKGEYGHKTADGKVYKKISNEKDTTSIFIDFFETIKPDILVTSAHASQRNLEMPFSTGNIICKDGKLFGKLTEGSRMIGANGQALDKKVQGTLIPIKQPNKPMIYFAPGNCLIGDIPDRNCMALAFMGWGKGTQMIGYTTTTWFGMVGWGAVKYWEGMAGYAPLNESLFFSKQNLLYRLKEQFPETANYQYDPEKGLSFQNIATDLAKITKTSGAVLQQNIGMIWDRDVVAFYGDPAHRVYHDKEFTVPANRKAKLTKGKNGTYQFTITALSDHGKPDKNSTPVAAFFPERLKNIKVLKGEQFKPVITDNFIMVTAPGPFKAGKDYEIIFKAEPIKRYK